MSKKLEFWCAKYVEADECPKCGERMIGHKVHARFSSDDFKCCTCLECGHEW